MLISGITHAADTKSPTTNNTASNSVASSVTAASTSASATLASGIDMKNINAVVRPQDDFYEYVNGKWLAKTEIPADKSSWGAFNELRESALTDLHTIVDKVSQTKTHKAGSSEQQIADLYASYMDEPALEKLGAKPLDSEFAKIDALKDKKEIAALIAHL
ncbi:MAG: M13 family peptidase, partial [Glaciimonas sp.]|nr:M13 family peptidase [Glaciimonas sp.]